MSLVCCEPIVVVRQLPTQPAEDTVIIGRRVQRDIVLISRDGVAQTVEVIVGPGRSEAQKKGTE